LLDRAVRILAMRDHSEQELRRKLAAPVMSKNGPEELDATPEDSTAWLPGAWKTVISTMIALSASSSPAAAAKAMARARIRQELNQKGCAGVIERRCANAISTGATCQGAGAA
jgi:regulatory protein